MEEQILPRTHGPAAGEGVRRLSRLRRSWIPDRSQPQLLQAFLPPADRDAVRWLVPGDAGRGPFPPGVDGRVVAPRRRPCPSPPGDREEGLSGGRNPARARR